MIDHVLRGCVDASRRSQQLASSGNTTTTVHESRLEHNSVSNARAVVLPLDHPCTDVVKVGMVDRTARPPSKKALVRQCLSFGVETGGGHFDPNCLCLGLCSSVGLPSKRVVVTGLAALGIPCDTPQQ